jgi:hypothetical protein
LRSQVGDVDSKIPEVVHVRTMRSHPLLVEHAETPEMPANSPHIYQKVKMKQKSK